VVPEYNHGMPPALLNALDFLYQEWNYKPAAFVSYGGLSGGVRSVQMAKPVLTAQKMMPIPEAVAVPFYTKHVSETGAFEPGDLLDASATTMLDELLRWAKALAPMRG
jgi:NAD(P)H-dependent FMN reductase